MLFNSVDFLIFFPTVTILYFLTPHRFRWSLLLAASCVFYMSFIPAYILIIFTVIVIDYFAALLMENRKGIARKILFFGSIILTCLVLFIFKYFNFFTVNVEALARFFHWNYSPKILNLVLPIGLSFYTLQSLSYVIEVYRGKQCAERRFGIFAVYVMFFPQLVAGPIERPGNLLPQFYEKHKFDYIAVTDGLKLMVWGLFKKVVIADRLALFVNQVYNNTHEYQGVSFIMATVFFSFQIYCDFSGYSDMAIGAAQVMGFRLMDNFNRPYFSRSINEFWKRWHISLSSWFRDYVYIPLGGNRVSQHRWYFNMLVVFLLSGLWHGADWTFIAWGLLNVSYMIFGVVTGPWRKRAADRLGMNRDAGIYKYSRIICTFLLITFSWIFFRANSIGDAVYIVRHLFSGVFDYIYVFVTTVASEGTGKMRPILAGQTPAQFGIAIFSIMLMELVHAVQSHGRIRHMLREKPALLRWIFYYGIVLCIFLFGVFDGNQFIYFQF